MAVLRKIADDNAASAYARVFAARALIESSFRANELHDVTERRRGIEDRLLSQHSAPRQLSRGA